MTAQVTSSQILSELNSIDAVVTKLSPYKESYIKSDYYDTKDSAEFLYQTNRTLFREIHGPNSTPDSIEMDGKAPAHYLDNLDLWGYERMCDVLYKYDSL